MNVESNIAREVDASVRTVERIVSIEVGKEEEGDVQVASPVENRVALL